jgi:hypothetical protein
MVRLGPVSPHFAAPQPRSRDNSSPDNRKLQDLPLLPVTLPAVMVRATAAQKKNDTGVTDTEIKIGNIMPYSGPASAYGIIGKTMSPIFR